MHGVIGIFLICFVGILITAYWSIESIKAVSEKFNLSDTFVGAVFLSVGTSFPEFINSIVSGFHDAKSEQPLYAMYSFYNVTGANIWQIVFLVFLLIVMAVVCTFNRKREKDLDQIVQIFWNDTVLSWKLVFWETALLCAVFFFPQVFRGFIFKGFSVINIVFVIIWLWYIRWTFYHKPSIDKKESSKYFKTLSKNALIAVTVLLWILFGSLAYANFQISTQFPVEGSKAFGIILSFITSSPEFSVLYFLFKQREYLIAVGGFFGSSLFNLTLPAYTNLISANPIFGRELVITHNESGNISTSKIACWLLLNLVLLGLFLLSFSDKKTGSKFMFLVSGVLVIGTYVWVNMFFSSWI